MSLLNQEIKELRQLAVMFQNDKLSPEKLAGTLSIFNEVDKRIKNVIVIEAMKARYGNKTAKGLETAGYIGGDSVLDLNEVSEQTVYCRDKDRAVSRRACKEYSEMTPNVTSCQSCPNWKLTRQLLSERTPV